MILNLLATGSWGGVVNLQETGARWWHSSRKDKVGIPQYASLRLSIPCKSSRTCGKSWISQMRHQHSVLKTNVLIWGLFRSTTMKAAVHLGPNDIENLEVYRTTNFAELQNLFDITQRLTLDHQAEILNVAPNDWTAPSMDEICPYARSSDHVDESKSTRLLRFRLMLGKDARSFRSEPKMQKSSRRIPTVQFLQRIIWIWWRNDRVRVEYFPGTCFIGDPLEDPARPARSEHWSRTIWRLDHLHVNVQWLRLDKERKFRKMYFKLRTARTLDILRPGKRKEMVQNSQLNTWRKMGFHLERFKETGHCIQEHQCLESWNSEEEKWQRYQTLQCSYFARFTQQISSVFTEQSHAGVKSSLKHHVKKKILQTGLHPKKMKRYWRLWIHKKWTLCTDSKEAAGIQKRTAKKSPEFWITFQHRSVYEGLRKRFVLAQGVGWYDLQADSWLGRCFWSFHPSMLSVHMSSSRPKIQSVCGNSTIKRLQIKQSRLRGKRKWATAGECEAARSEFFGGNSKEW